MKTLKNTLAILFIVFVTINGYSQEVSKLYHDSGELKAVGQRDENGEGIGEWKFYLKSGEMFALVNYKHNTLNGVYKEYYNSGELFYEMNYTNGKKNGLKKIYYKTGKLKETLNFVDDKQIYDWDAILEKSNDDYESVVSGKCVSGDCDNGYGKRERGDHTFEGAFKNGKLHGKGTHIEINTLWVNEPRYKIKYVGNWENGEKTGQGTETGYSKTKNIIYRYIGAWENDKKNGNGKEYRNDVLVYEGNFKNNHHQKLKDCITGNCKDGYGVFIYPNKNKYIGEFKNGLKDGFGIETDSKGNYVYGDWKSNKEEGYIRVFNKKNEIIFAGEMKNGKPIKGLNDNGVEIGCTTGDCENGFGYYKFENGDLYVGEFKNGLKHGYAIYKWNDKSKYVGEFYEGILEGYGKEYDANGEMVKIGKYISGEYVSESDKPKVNCILGNCKSGFGILAVPLPSEWKRGYEEYKNDFESKYEGIWFVEFQNEIGFLEDKHGNTYVGNFKADEYQGKGTATFINGDQYNGDFDDGSMNGFGTMTYSDGSKYMGEWSYNDKEGKGKEYDKNGKLLYSGDYNNGERGD